MCLANEKLTELLEICITIPKLSISKGKKNCNYSILTIVFYLLKKKYENILVLTIIATTKKCHLIIR